MEIRLAIDQSACILLQWQVEELKLVLLRTHCEDQHMRDVHQQHLCMLCALRAEEPRSHGGLSQRGL